MKARTGSRLLLVLVTLAACGWADQLRVRINNNLSSATSKAGDRFDGQLVDAATVGGRSCPVGSRVDGQVTAAKPSGRLSNSGVLELTINRINCSGRSYTVNQPLRLEGTSHTKRNVALIGGGTAAGAVIGGMAGGTKGAVIGAAAGAGAGTATAAATGKKEAKVEPEAVLTWDVPAQALSSATSSVGRDYSAERGGLVLPNQQRERDRWPEFSDDDRRVISHCLSGRNGLPPGLAKKDRLPPGLEKQLRRNGTLPPGLQKKVQPLPVACGVNLPRIPDGWARVILGRNVLLLNPRQVIADMFQLN